MNGMNHRERETPATNPIITAPSSLLIHHLPSNITEDSLRSMVIWSKDFIDAIVLPHDSEKESSSFRSAILHFRTHLAAQQARNLLDGKQNVAKDAQMVVEFYYGRLPNGDASSNSSAASSAGPTPRQSSRFNGTFQSREKVSPGNNYTSNELPNPDFSNHYQTLFSPQSPIGNHLNDRTRISGKSLINNDTIDDDETGELIKDPISWAENGAGLPRRSTLPHLHLSRMANLTLSTSNGAMTANHMPPPPPYQSQQTMANMQAHAGPMSPSAMNGGPPANYQLGSQHYQRHNFPPVNPADQNPPCNTLYVGNLPIDTSEDELKQMFTKQRGYKRLCFRTKQNGPMCFVEFEDISFATKALHELYGHPLHNSIKGGIRLSFSKNPLGVRSGQGVGSATPTASNGGMMHMNGMMNGGLGGSAFATANGPPPGLTAPPGLGHSRGGYIGSMMNHQNGMGAGQYVNGYTTQPGMSWTGQHNYPRSMTAGGPPNLMNGGNQSFPPAYMMGR